MREHAGPVQWKFAQCFGEKDELETIAEADIITTLEFDASGDYLATGDKGGRAVLFQRDANRRHCEYHFFSEFQSHEPEFDYLKSLQIEERINKIKWCKRLTQSHFLLTTNDKVIKLWRVNEKAIYNVVENNSIQFRGQYTNVCNQAAMLALPKLKLQEEVMFAMPKKIYSSAHAYHINSLSINSDGETFISADDLRIHLWHLDNEQQSFNIVDLKPSNMEDLTEVITCAEFHPTNCSEFVYGTSKGLIKVCDLRKSAICDQSASVLEDKSAHVKSFFSEIIQSISDTKYSHDGRLILSRDYMHLKLWDVRMTQGPILTVPVHDQMFHKLADLYDNEAIFDRVLGREFMTGTYNNQLNVYGMDGSLKHTLLSDKSIFLHKKKKDLEAEDRDAVLPEVSAGDSSPTAKASTDMSAGLDYQKRLLHATWHPREDTMAIAATNNLFVFNAT